MTAKWRKFKKVESIFENKVAQKLHKPKSAEQVKIKNP